MNYSQLNLEHIVFTAMAIRFGRRRFATVYSLSAGDLIQFGYNGKTRTAVVINPEWKENCDCYVFDQLDDISEDFLRNALEGQTEGSLSGGDLYTQFGNQFDFKSFKLNNMSAIQTVQYYLYNEDFVDEEEVTDNELQTNIFNEGESYGVLRNF